MLEYQRIGVLIGAGPAPELSLPAGRPLSYLRVQATSSDRSVGMTRVLLERRATEFRVRVPVVMEAGGDHRERIVAALERFGSSTVYPLLEGRSPDRVGAVDVCWLDWVQMASVGRALETGFRKRDGAVAVAGLKVSPTYECARAGEAPKRDWQYWNSRWEFAEPPRAREDWWRVRPNESRDRRRFPRLRRPQPGFGPQARGTFAACLHPEMRKALGDPRYLVVSHPFRKGWLPVLALDDEFEGHDKEVWDRTIFLDRTARDALGVSDGEFCLVYPWLRPRRSIWWRGVRDRAIGSRTIAAHARAPARADLEKPVCRLEPQVLAAIGGRPGESVVLEYVAPPRNEQPSRRWERVRVSQRVLPIDPQERAERQRWEAPQIGDDGPNPGGGEEAPELQGYVDCAERLGVYPPYPAIYLNYYTRRYGLRNLGLCQPVQVRVGLPGRLMAEASEFVWLAVIALLGAAIAFLHSSTLQILAAAALALATAVLLLFRAIRAIR